MHTLRQRITSFIALLKRPFQEHQRKAWLARLARDEASFSRKLVYRKRLVKNERNEARRAQELAYLNVCTFKVDDIISFVAPGKRREDLTTLEIRQALYEMHLRDAGLTAGPIASQTEFIAPGFGRPQDLVPLPM